MQIYQRLGTVMKQATSALLGMTLELPQRCFAADIEEADVALLAAGDEQAPVVPVGGTVRSIPESGERLDGFLGVTTIDVDLAKQEGITSACVILPEQQQQKSLRKATYPRGCCDGIVIWRDWGEVNFIYGTEFLYLNRCLKQL